MSIFRLAVACVASLLVAQIAHADLPVRCLHGQVIGKWKIHVYKANTAVDTVQCGYRSPDNPIHPGLTPPNIDSARFTKLEDHGFEMWLDANRVFEEKDGAYVPVGQWTMVYDEGFHVTKLNLGANDNRGALSLEMFAFSKYVIPNGGNPKSSDQATNARNSDCGKTMLGWMDHNIDEVTKEKYCWWGEQTQAITKEKEEVEAEQFVEHGEPGVIDSFLSRSRETPMTVSHFVDVANSQSGNHPDAYRAALPKGVDGSLTLQQLYEHRHVKMMGFYTSEQLHAKIAGHVLARLQAAPMPREASMLQIIHGHDASIEQYGGNNNAMVGGDQNGDARERSNEWKKMANFTWTDVNGVNYVPRVPDQGGCGSCYAVAATSMFTSRLWIRYPALREKEVRVSAQRVLDCNYLTQGCDGGYPYLVSMFGQKHHLTEESAECFPYLGSNSAPVTMDQCHARETGCKRKFHVENYTYVGGAYGDCGAQCEEDIREELFNGGPLALSLEPDETFMAYETGIITAAVRESIKAAVGQLPVSTPVTKLSAATLWKAPKVDHTVLLVGWGEAASGASMV